MKGAGEASKEGDWVAIYLFDRWGEGPVLGERKTRESDVSGLETAVEGADEVALWGGDVLFLDLARPEAVGDLGLSDAGRREVGVGPGAGVVAVELGPVALERRGGDVSVCFFCRGGLGSWR